MAVKVQRDEPSRRATAVEVHDQEEPRLSCGRANIVDTPQRRPGGRGGCDRGGDASGESCRPSAARRTRPKSKAEMTTVEVLGREESHPSWGSAKIVGAHPLAERVAARGGGGEGSGGGWPGSARRTRPGSEMTQRSEADPARERREDEDSRSRWSRGAAPHMGTCGDRRRTPMAKRVAAMGERRRQRGRLAQCSQANPAGPGGAR